MSELALFLTHVPPAPAISGDRVRTLALMRQARAHGWRIAAFSVCSPQEAASGPHDDLRELCEAIELVPFSRAGGRAFRLATDICARRAYHERYFLTPGGPARLATFAGRLQPQAIVAGTLYAMPYLDRLTAPPVLLDTQNVETSRLSSMARGSGPRSLAARLQLGPVERYERRSLERAQRVLAVSELDRRHFERLAPGRVDLVENGVDCRAILPRADALREPVVLFVGSLDYGPNVEAAALLVQRIAPLLETPAARIVLVGSNPRDEVETVLAGASVDCELRANVPSVLPSLDEAAALAVPLLAGGGTRLKILEAFARGVPVVSSSVGCEGLDCRDGEHLLVADDPVSFAAALDRLLASPELARGLAERARALVVERYDWSRIGEAFAASLERVSRGRS